MPGLLRVECAMHGAPAAPAVEFLSAVQVAESDGTNTFTAMSGSYTPHADADFFLGIQLLRNAATKMAGSAMSFNSISMGTAITNDEAFSVGTNRTYIIAFGTAAFTPGAAATLAYTRTAGTGSTGQLWGASFKNVGSVGTPVKTNDFATTGASPAEATITPIAIGDMLVVIVNIEPNSANLTPADNVLTPVNCTERLDLFSNGPSIANETCCGLGTLLADAVASETLGFSFTGGAADNWTCHAIPLLKAA